MAIKKDAASVTPASKQTAVKTPTYKIREIETEDGGVRLTLCRNNKQLVSFPAMLNSFTKPTVEDGVAILEGQGIELGRVTPITIYRIENKTNHQGMYNCEPEPSLMDCPYYNAREQRSKLHPRPEDDSKLARQMCARRLINPNPLALILRGTSLTQEAENWRYGFSSVDQARMWLHNDQIINWLAEHNFVVAEFNVGPFDAMVGNTQAMFINSPKRQKTHNMKDFFKV